MTTERRGRAPAGCRRRASQRAIDVTRPQPWAASSDAPGDVPFGRMSPGPLLRSLPGHERAERRLEALEEHRGALGLDRGEVVPLLRIAREVEQHVLAARRADELVAPVV